MWNFITNQFSVNQQGFSQSWAFWAVILAGVVLCLLWKLHVQKSVKAR